MRVYSKGYDYANPSESELSRLHIQAEILSDFEMPVYKSVFELYTKPVIIDIGCNDGFCSMNRLERFEYSFYLGIDRSDSAIQKAMKNFGSSDRIFLTCNVEDGEFEKKVFQELSEHYFNGADIIVVSMVLLHLDNPEGLLSILHGMLNPTGVIIVKDIDDRDNKSSVDPDGIFSRAYEIAHSNSASGNRHTGRNIPIWLEKCGYHNVILQASGLSTDGMTKEQREALYTTYFGFFEEDCKTEISLNHGCGDDLHWCSAELPKIKKLFEDEDFSFSLGFCIYTAGK